MEIPLHDEEFGEAVFLDHPSRHEHGQNAGGKWTRML
jgi:hypothetical protein